MSQEIEVALIFRSPHGRPLNRLNVTKLAASIEQVGLIHPICVRRVVRHRGSTPFDAFEIVGGHHRYAAALELNWRVVRCEVVELDGLRAELAEVDENLVRANLTAAQEALAISRRKVIYETLFPQTREHVAGAHGANRAQGRDAADILSAAFAAATAEAIGKDERTVRRAAARGKALGDELVSIAGTPLDKGVELDALTKLPAGERAPLIERARAGETVSARNSRRNESVVADRQRRALAAQEKWRAKFQAEDEAVQEAQAAKASENAVDLLQRHLDLEILARLNRLVAASAANFPAALNARLLSVGHGVLESNDARSAEQVK